MYPFLRSLLFCLPAEASHDFALSILSRASNSSLLLPWIQKHYGDKVSSLPTSIMGLHFPNPVGLAAGLDKQGSCANVMNAFGFGWVEMGTVTPLPQSGNSKPRMFRLTEHQGVINRMGFNSCGLESFLGHIAATRPGIIKGINIGKNALTPVENAADDYLSGMRAVYSVADYIAINISSPNTANLRALQQGRCPGSIIKKYC